MISSQNLNVSYQSVRGPKRRVTGIMTFANHLNASLTKDLKADPEQIYDAWLTPKLIKRWMFPDGNLVRVEIENRVGGEFIFTDKRGRQLIEHVGSYLELERPSRLVFTWATVDDLPDIDRVFVEIESTDTGSQLTLTHQLHPNWDEYKDQTIDAWDKMITAMQDQLNF